MKAEKRFPGSVLSGVSSHPPEQLYFFTSPNLTEARFHCKMQNVVDRSRVHEYMW
jgi:hypothetical protein